MALPRKLTFVTGNSGKFAEMQAHLAPLGIEVVQETCGYPEIQADSLQEIAAAGAKHLQPTVEAPFVLEDAGFFVHALKGFPGPFSAYGQQTIGNEGILRLMANVESELRSAHFEACLTYVDTEIHQFTGRCKGNVATQAAGDQGFGYDPIFVPEGESRTFAQMSGLDKGKISHRGRANDQFIAWLANQ